MTEATTTTEPEPRASQVGEHSSATAERAGEAAPIESATASTACQTNSSRFAYVLAGCALGAAYLVIVVAIAFVAYVVQNRYADSTGSYDLSGGYLYEYRYDYEDGADADGGFSLSAEDTSG